MHLDIPLIFSLCCMNWHHTRTQFSSFQLRLDYIQYHKPLYNYLLKHNIHPVHEHNHSLIPREPFGQHPVGIEYHSVRNPLHNVNQLISSHQFFDPIIFLRPPLFLHNQSHYTSKLSHIHTYVNSSLNTQLHLPYNDRIHLGKPNQLF